MDFRIKTTDYQLSPDVESYLQARIAPIEKMLAADAPNSRLEAELGRATGRHRHSDYQYFAELQLLRPGYGRIVARNHEAVMNAAIDRAKDELVRQLKRESKLHVRMWRKSGGLAKRLLRLGG